MSTTLSTSSLSDIMTGRVIVPDDGAWDSARRAFNPAVDQRPLAVAYPVDERDVIAVVAYARERGLRIAPQRTGHNAGPLGSLHDAILMNLRQLDEVSIDAAARRVRVGAGATWQDVTPALSATVWRRCTARRPASGSPATRSSAAWDGWPASTACRPTA